MASFLQKLLKNPPPSSPLRTLLTSLNASYLSDPPPPRFPLLQIHPPALTPDTNTSPHSLRIYPSFPHCFDLEPISISGIDRADAGINGEVESGEDGTAVWADSVKKKRKRKMNKHKYRKLRKRLRRQT